MNQRLLERTVELARTTKAFDFKKLPKTLWVAVDSSPLEDAGPLGGRQADLRGRQADLGGRRADLSAQSQQSQAYAAVVGDRLTASGGGRRAVSGVGSLGSSGEADADPRRR